MISIQTLIEGTVGEIQVKPEAPSTPTKLKPSTPQRPPSERKPKGPPLSEYVCPICYSPPTRATLTPCGHILCASCLVESISSARERAGGGPGSPAHCPLCRAVLKGWDGKGGGVIGLEVKLGGGRS